MKVFDVTPRLIKTLHCQLKLPRRPPPLSLLRPAQSTNRAASDRQGHSFSSTHSPCGWEAQWSMPVGNLLPSQYPLLLTHKPDHWKSLQRSQKCLHTQTTCGLFSAADVHSRWFHVNTSAVWYLDNVISYVGKVLVYFTKGILGRGRSQEEHKSKHTQTHTQTHTHTPDPSVIVTGRNPLATKNLTLTLTLTLTQKNTHNFGPTHIILLP